MMVSPTPAEVGQAPYAPPQEQPQLLTGRGSQEETPARPGPLRAIEVGLAALVVLLAAGLLWARRSA